MKNMIEGLQKDLGIDQIVNVLNAVVVRLQALETRVSPQETTDKPAVAAVDVAPEVTAPEQEPAPVETPKPAPKKAAAKKAAPVKEVPSVTAEDIRAGLIDIAKKLKSRDAALTVLSNYGARTVQDLSPDKYSTVMAEINKILTEG